MTAAAPIRVAIVNDHELVVHGVLGLLADRSDRIVVVELDCDLPVSQPVDLALYDAFTMQGLESDGMAQLLADPLVGGVVLYTWNVVPDIVEQARRLGLRGVLSKSLGAAGLADALEQCARRAPESDQRSMLVEPGVLPPGVAATLPVSDGDWPGRQNGLTFREAEVVALITLGLSNQQIADRIHLSINSVKTYIRTAYRTMGVTTRSQAVLWGLDHGLRRRRARFTPDTDRAEP